VCVCVCARAHARVQVYVREYKGHVHAICLDLRNERSRRRDRLRHREEAAATQKKETNKSLPATNLSSNTQPDSKHAGGGGVTLWGVGGVGGHCNPSREKSEAAVMSAGVDDSLSSKACQQLVSKACQQLRKHASSCRRQQQPWTVRQAADML
jgi:hypothetical protein